jgi:hypothetical protein
VTHTPIAEQHRPHRGRFPVRGTVAGLILLCGCLVITGAAGVSAKVQPKEVAKLDVKRKMALDLGEAKAFDLEAQSGAQTITVEFSSSKGAVSVYVFKEEDAIGDELLISDPKKALAGARAKAGVIKADVPAKTATRVIIRGAAEMTTVEVKLANQLVPDARDAKIKKLEDENAALRKEVAELKKQLDDIKKKPEKK